MKKFLSLIMVAAMLVAVFAMVGCDKDPVETTTEATTTEATTTEQTTTEQTTTETTTEATTEDTTTEATTEDTTTEATTEDTTTEATTETTTADTEAAETTTGTTLDIFARFDFGTATKAEAEGKTSHTYLLGALTYEEDYIALVWTEDTVVIYATTSYDDYAKNNKDTYALWFDDLTTYDFMDEFIPGFGGFTNAPLGAPGAWQGRHQYGKLRIRNTSTNNIIGMAFKRMGESYATTLYAGGMYLQGGIPTSAWNAGNPRKTTATEEWAVYYYDMVFLAAAGREANYNSVTFYNSYVAMRDGGYYAQNNWNNANGAISGVRFHFLENWSKASYNDTRSYVTQGTHVEVDYFVFGSSIDQLKTYTSYIEDAANAEA